MNEIITNLWENIQIIALLVGVGVVLHYWAFAIAWGIRKGMAKVPTKNTTDINVISKKD